MFSSLTASKAKPKEKFYNFTDSNCLLLFKMPRGLKDETFLNIARVFHLWYSKFIEGDHDEVKSQ